MPGCTTKEKKGTVPAGRKKKGSEDDKSIYPTNLKNRMLQGNQGKDGGSEVPFRHRNGCICAIDILAELFSTKSKREAGKKLARYMSGKERDNFTSFPRFEFPLRGRPGTQLLCVGSWKQFYLLTAKCKDKRKVESFLERHRVFLDSCFGKSCENCSDEPPLRKPDEKFGEIALAKLRTCSCSPPTCENGKWKVILFPHSEMLPLDTLVDDLGQAFHHCYTIEKSSKYHSGTKKMTYIRLACQARGNPIRGSNERRSRESIKCACESFCNVIVKDVDGIGERIVNGHPSLYFIHRHECSSPASGAYRPLHPELVQFILEHKSMTGQLGDLQQLCTEKGKEIAARLQNIVLPGPDGRFKPTLRQIQLVQHNAALKTWRRGNDPTNLKAWCEEIKTSHQATVFFRPSQANSNNMEGKVLAYLPTQEVAQPLWVYDGKAYDAPPYVSTQLEPYEYSMVENSKAIRQRFLFLVLSKEGKYMLEKYGCWGGIDSTYRLNMYGFPVTVFVVKTNMGKGYPAFYYITDLEDNIAHTEAIALARWACPSWRPQTIVSDCAFELVNAVEANFPEARCIWCHFHVEQALLKHLKRPSSKMPSEDVRKSIHKSLRNLMYAKDADEFEKAEEIFITRATELGLAATLKYYQEYMKKHQKRWASFERVSKTCWGHTKKIDTNNLNESFNGKLKKQFGLERNKLMTKLAMKLWNVGEKMWQDYLYENAIQGNDTRTVYVDKCNKPHPSLLTPRRPDVVVRTLHSNWQRALKMKLDVVSANDGERTAWVVHGKRNKHVISRVDMSWTCTCYIAARTSIPCIHVFAVLHHEGLDFSVVELTQNHHIIDWECVACCGCLQVMQSVGDQCPINSSTSRDECYTHDTDPEANVPSENDPHCGPSADSVASTIARVRSGLYNARISTPGYSLLVRSVLQAVEKFVSANHEDQPTSSESVKSQAIASAGRIASLICLLPGNEQEKRMNQCQPLLAGLLCAIQALVPSMQSPKRSERNKRRGPQHSPEEKFLKTSKLHHAIERRRRKLM